MIDNGEISKGFAADENGESQILLEGKIIRGNWVWGWPVLPDEYDPMNEKAWIITKYPNAVEVIQDTLCAYSGATTTFGALICECDLVRFQYGRWFLDGGEVVRDRGCFGVMLDDGEFIALREFTDSVIDGNAFDVPGTSEE